MSLHSYIIKFRRAVEKLENYGYADDAVHRPSLGFKEHKHTKDGKIIESPLPSISDLVDEVIRYL